ncbi:hypothetical protein RGR602_PB00353 (plasmid) [Rhizobium gallicum bv. gallicum R602sp]|uniref:Uncharacterized protein n=1 Tax=Rhizobium gallicum bv. gallicum R602sp TaxID=1041138 RepID=A0A0B4XAX2_9HYPH|nr:hypothetical protein RGR602_PB00353 [Rhizobium gallicum bv. gallicum R602sp]
MSPTERIGVANHPSATRSGTAESRYIEGHDAKVPSLCGRKFCLYFCRSPDRLSLDDVQPSNFISYQQFVCALRFLMG